MRHNVLNDLWRTAREKPDKLAFSDGVNGLTFGEVCRQSRAVGTFLHQRGICRRPVVERGALAHRWPEAASMCLWTRKCPPDGFS